MKVVSFVIVLCLLVIADGRGQSSDSASIVFDAHPSARFVVNGEVSRVRPGDTLVVPSGTVIVEQIAGGAFVWTTHRFVDTVEVGAGAIRTIAFPALMEHVIRTRPSGARVMLHGAVLGTTPYRYAHTALTESPLDLVLEGYEPMMLRPNPANETIDLTPLVPDGALADVAVRPVAPPLNDKTMTLVSGILMIASGVGSALLKDRANRSLDEYTRTLDPRALDDVRHYDRLSGYAAVTMQISFAGFAYLLAAR